MVKGDLVSINGYHEVTRIITNGDITKCQLENGNWYFEQELTKAPEPKGFIHCQYKTCIHAPEGMEEVHLAILPQGREAPVVPNGNLIFRIDKFEFAQFDLRRLHGRRLLCHDRCSEILLNLAITFDRNGQKQHKTQ